MSQARVLPGVVVRLAEPADAGEILTVQRAAFVTEAQLNDRTDLPPLTEGLADVMAAIADPGVLMVAAVAEGPRGRRLVGSARVRFDDRTGTGQVGRIAAAPDLHGQGIGTALLSAAERLALSQWPEMVRFELFTGATSTRNTGWYQLMGYELVGQNQDSAGIPVVVLSKPTRGVNPG